MRARLALAGILGVGGLGAALALLARDVGPFATPERRVHLEDAAPATLDTVGFRGRRIEASVTGRVVEVSADGTVWLAAHGDAFPLRLEADSIAVEDRLMATGRLRGRGGRRWLEVRSWVRVESAVRPPGTGE